MGKTSIEYVDHSVNPIRARIRGVTDDSGHFCVKVSPGCKNCYASRLQPRFGLPVFQDQRGDLEPELFLDPKVLESVLRRRKATRYFWCDMTDMFGGWVSDAWIAACFGVMAATPQHTHLVFTKRAKRMREWFAWAAKRGDHGKSMFPDDDDAWCIRQMCHVEARRAGAHHDSLQNHGGPWPLPNVMLLVSAEDQKRADERIPDLLATPAARRGVSVEPMLGPVDLSIYLARGVIEAKPGDADYDALDWVICGGESGPKARPFDVVAAEDLARQCKEAGVAFYMKQLGAWPFDSREPERDRGPSRIRLGNRKGGDPSEWAEHLRVRQFPA